MGMVWWISGEGPLAAYAVGYQGELERRAFSPRRAGPYGGRGPAGPLAGRGRSSRFRPGSSPGRAVLRGATGWRVPAMPTLAPLFAYLRDQQVLLPEQAAKTPAEELLAATAAISLRSEARRR